MEYCLGAEDGSATMWTAPPDIDLDGDGILDAVALDFDADGNLDDAMVDLDGDALADHAALDLDDDGFPESYFVDDGAGTWAVMVDRPPKLAGVPGGELQWSGLDGVSRTGGPLVDLDGDGRATDRLFDSDGDGVADRAFTGESAYVDTNGDGRWDIRLADSDGDGVADSATTL